MDYGSLIIIKIKIQQQMLKKNKILVEYPVS